MIHRIESLTEMLELIPVITKLHKQLDGLWEPDLDDGEFVNELTNSCIHGGILFAEKAEDGKLKYVALLKPENAEHYVFWLFYMNPKFRDITRSVINELIDFCHHNKIRRVRWATTRLTSSYERWISKFGARKFAMLYQLEL